MEIYFLDTDICSYIMKRSSVRVLEKLRTVEIERIFISVVTEAELLFGVNLSNDPQRDRAACDEFVTHVSVLEWSRDAAQHYADIRADLHRRGEMIGANDLMIAAHARSLDATLVTNNEREFRRVNQLRVQNWAR